MVRFTNAIKSFWLDMLVPPWRHSGPDDRFDHWASWLIGWAWALSGLVLGALIAPLLVRFAGLSNASYQDALVIGIAVFAGFVVQLFGWCLWLFFFLCIQNMPEYLRVWGTPVVLVLPLAASGYGVYRYLTWVGAGQRSVTIAFVGGLLIKTFIIPAIWGAIKSRAFQAFMRWLRGDKVKTKGA